MPKSHKTGSKPDVLAELTRRTTVDDEPVSRRLHVLVQATVTAPLLQFDDEEARSVARSLESALGAVRKTLSESGSPYPQKVTAEYTAGYLDMAADLYAFLMEREERRVAKAETSKRGAVRSAALALSRRRSKWSREDLCDDLARANSETSDSNISHALNQLVERGRLRRLTDEEKPEGADHRRSWFTAGDNDPETRDG